MATLIIEAGRSEGQYWFDLWRYRELLCFLSWRDILVRYRQTVLGVAWALIRPLLTMVVFTVIFGKIAGLPSGGAPYPILVFTAMLPWQFFSNAISACGESLLGNANLISKVYFPRLLVPVSALFVSFIEFLIAGAILAGLMIYYAFLPSWRLVLLPALALLTCSAALGAGLWVGALNVKYRDFRYIVPFLVQLGLYVSPVGFNSAVVPAEWRFWYSLNPMVGVIDGFRWAVLGQDFELYLPGFALSLAIVALLLISGIHYFRKTERTFADII